MPQHPNVALRPGRRRTRQGERPHALGKVAEETDGTFQMTVEQIYADDTHGDDQEALEHFFNE